MHSKKNPFFQAALLSRHGVTSSTLLRKADIGLF